MNDRRDWRYWLARLVFSFLIIAALLVWTAYQAATDPNRAVPAWKMTLYVLGAGAALSMAGLGMRYRHRSDGE